MVRILCAAIALVVPVTGTAAHGDIIEMHVLADGECADSGSPGIGVGTFSVDTTTASVDYTLSFSNLVPEFVHLHGPADDCVLSFFAPTQVWFTEEMESSGVFLLDPDQLADMLAEKYWLNVHTQVHKGGEIRGQVLLRCPDDCSGQGLCTAGVCACDPGWVGPSCAEPAPVPATGLMGVAVTVMVVLGIGIKVVLHCERQPIDTGRT